MTNIHQYNFYNDKKKLEKSQSAFQACEDILIKISKLEIFVKEDKKEVNTDAEDNKTNADICIKLLYCLRQIKDSLRYSKELSDRCKALLEKYHSLSKIFYKEEDFEEYKKLYKQLFDKASEFFFNMQFPNAEPIGNLEVPIKNLKLKIASKIFVCRAVGNTNKPIYHLDLDLDNNQSNRLIEIKNVYISRMSINKAIYEKPIKLYEKKDFVDFKIVASYQQRGYSSRGDIYISIPIQTDNSCIQKDILVIKLHYKTIKEDYASIEDTQLPLKQFFEYVKVKNKRDLKSFLKKVDKLQYDKFQAEAEKSASSKKNKIELIEEKIKDKPQLQNKTNKSCMKLSKKIGNELSEIFSQKKFSKEQEKVKEILAKEKELFDDNVNNKSAKPDKTLADIEFENKNKDITLRDRKIYLIKIDKQYQEGDENLLLSQINNYLREVNSDWIKVPKNKESIF